MGELEERTPMAELPMILPPAAQAVAASGSSKGAPLFVAADPDLVAKDGVLLDSWFFISHLTCGSNRLDLLVHYMQLTRPQPDPVLQTMDSVSGTSLAKEKDYKVSEIILTTTSLDVQTPSSGDASAMHI